VTAPTEEPEPAAKWAPNEDRPPRRVAAMSADKRRGIYILAASSGALIAALLFRWWV
jgi:hypothetical protein